MYRFLFFTLLIAFASCKKEGCMDTDAANYDDAAKKEESGSCKYRANVVFWWNESTKNWLFYDNAANKVSFYIDDELMGTHGTLSSWVTEPECDDYGTIKFLTELGTSKSSNSTYRVLDDSNDVIWTGTLSLEANGCVVVKLSE